MPDPSDSYPNLEHSPFTAERALLDAGHAEEASRQLEMQLLRTNLPSHQAAIHAVMGECAQALDHPEMAASHYLMAHSTLGTIMPFSTNNMGYWLHITVGLETALHLHNPKEWTAPRGSRAFLNLLSNVQRHHGTLNPSVLPTLLLTLGIFEGRCPPDQQKSDNIYFLNRALETCSADSWRLRLKIHQAQLGAQLASPAVDASKVREAMQDCQDVLARHDPDHTLRRERAVAAMLMLQPSFPEGLATIKTVQSELDLVTKGMSPNSLRGLRAQVQLISEKSLRWH